LRPRQDKAMGETKRVSKPMKKSARRTQKNEEVAEIHHAPDLILGDNNEEDEDYITYYRAGDEEGVLRSVILTYNIIFHNN
jgi:hypothetical protein